MALTDKLTSIADAIREKGGTTEKLTLAQMPDAIAAIQAGGGEDLVPNPLVFSGDCEYAFGNNKYNWLIENYGDRIQTKDITTGSYMFGDSTELETIPFDINGKISGNPQFLYTFIRCSNLKSCGKITIPLYNVRGMFSYCHNLRYLPEIEFTTASYGIDSNGLGELFQHCYSLREIPEKLLGKLVNPNGGTSSNGTVFNGLTYLSTIDEINGIPTNTTTLNSNCMGSMFKYCYRLKKATFRTNNGTPYTANWKNQSIDLSQYTGWAGYNNAEKNILNYNSGITAEDEDNDWSNNPNYWSKQFIYSRFNHDSAVEFINSLPDTSAYVAAQNAANNAVKFYTNAGSNTDGGSVSALTEEEVAVAAAKGWSIGYTT